MHQCCKCILLIVSSYSTEFFCEIKLQIGQQISIVKMLLVVPNALSCCCDVLPVLAFNMVYSTVKSLFYSLIL